MDLELLQGVAVRIPLKAYLASDHNSPATGKTIPVQISKNMAAFANPSAGATNLTERSNGWYYVDLSTTDTNTLGPLIVRGTEGTIDDTEKAYNVVSATNRGTTGIPNAAAGASGGLLVFGTGAGGVNPSGGKVPATVAAADVTGNPSVSLSSANVTGNLPVDVQTIKTQTVTCAAGVTVGPYVGNASAALQVNATGYAKVATGTSTGEISLSGGKPAVTLSSADVSGNLPADLQTIKTQSLVASGTITFPAGTIASTANITSASGIMLAPATHTGAVIPTVSTVTATTDVTNAVTVGTNNDKTGYSLNLAQAVPTSNTANTTGDCLNAARAQGFGKWVRSGTDLTLYAPDGTTVVRAFTLDSASAPSQRA